MEGNAYSPDDQWGQLWGGQVMELGGLSELPLPLRAGVVTGKNNIILLSRIQNIELADDVTYVHAHAFNRGNGSLGFPGHLKLVLANLHHCDELQGCDALSTHLGGGTSIAKPADPCEACQP